MAKSRKSKAKPPKQVRSIELVNAIFEATVRILPKIGNKALTTKKIAEIAGISIGSFYQYFPNKEALLGAVMDRSIQSTAAKIEKKISELNGKSMDESVDFFVDFALELFLKDKETLREVFRRAPELGRIPSILRLREHTVQKLALEIKRHEPQIDPDEARRVGFVAVNAVLGVIQTVIYDEQQKNETHDLAVELKMMVKAYFEMKKLSLS